jgi:threonine dehydratase
MIFKEGTIIMSAVTLDDIHRARDIIRDSVRHTPLVPSQGLSDIAGVPVHLKLETLQDIGAFKIRGATNKLASLTDDEKLRGVVAVSTGNHGRGVAAAARKMGIRAVICMGNLVPENKLVGIKALGAEVRIIGKSQDDAEVEAQRLIDEEGLVNAHPFDDKYVIAGQGTIGLELLEDMPDVKTVIVPLSGGGLAGGIALALKASNPDVRVVGVSMEKGAAMIESIEAGKPVPVEELATLADSLGGGIGLENRYSFELCRDYIDDLITLTEEQIAAAMAHFYWKEQIIVEGGGSVGAGVILNNLAPDLQGPVAVVVSGRNVDMAKLHQIIDDHPPVN